MGKMMLGESLAARRRLWTGVVSECKAIRHQEETAGDRRAAEMRGGGQQEIAKHCPRDV
jgi:hypothetical protein